MDDCILLYLLVSTRAVIGQFSGPYSPVRSVCCAVLCCAVLCCAVLCCAVLCCAVLCCVVQCGEVLIGVVWSCVDCCGVVCYFCDLVWSGLDLYYLFNYKCRFFLSTWGLVLT